MNRFSKEEVLDHLQKNHPQCPAKIRRRVIEGVANEPWIDANLGAAVGMVLQAAIRHLLTDYDAEIAKSSEADYAAIKRKFNRQATSIIESWNKSAG